MESLRGKTVAAAAPQQQPSFQTELFKQYGIFPNYQ
jgi:hypothetical protein